MHTVTLMKNSGGLVHVHGLVQSDAAWAALQLLIDQINDDQIVWLLDCLLAAELGEDYIY